MHRAAIRLVGGAVLIATVLLLGAASYELVAFVFGADPLAAVSLVDTELILLVILFLGLLQLTVLFWLRGQSPTGGQSHGEE